MVRILIAVLFLGFMAGCGVNSTFVYKPGAPAAARLTLPVKVAVLPFVDGTEDFTRRGSVLAGDVLTYNLAKAGWGGVMTALTPELWAKAFAEELAASRGFRSVRFYYNESELLDEDIRIEGTLAKATLSAAFEQPNEFAISLRALRRTNNQPVWEKNVTRRWTNHNSLYDGCGALSIQCMVDRHKADTNRVMLNIFTEAGADLAKTLSSQSRKPAGEDGTSPAVSPLPLPDAESVDETIEGIIKGK